MIIKKMNRNLFSGQALLLVVLVMSVVVVVALSFVSRSVTEISVTNLEEDATRAFSAAEAGVEQALLTGQVGQSVNIEFPDSNSSVSANISLSGSGDHFNYPQPIVSGDSATFWFVGNDGLGNISCNGNCSRPSNIQVCYGAPGTPSDNNVTTPAIEVSLFYDSSPGNAVGSPNNFASVNVVRLTSDPNSTRRLSNNFSSASLGCNVGDRSYAFSTGNVNLNTLGIGCTNQAGCMLLAKVRMLYGNTSHPVGIRLIGGPNSNLPPQGRLIDSVGTSGSSTRRVQVFQGFPEPPSVFDSAIFSLNDLTK